MHGHIIAALCCDGKLVLVDCMAHETFHSIDLDDHIKIHNVVKLNIFKDTNSKYQVVIV